MAAEEQDDEGQEDVPVLTDAPAALASPRGDGGEGEAKGAAREDETLSPVRPGARSGGRTAGEIASDRPGVAAGDEAADETIAAAGEPWKDGPVWTVRSVEPAIDAAQELAAAERMEQAAEEWKTVRAGEAGTAASVGTAARSDFAPDELERAVRMQTAGDTPEGARHITADGAGLEGLYRQTARAARPAAPALPPEQAGRAVRAQEPGSGLSLAVDELDRAVRRDSWRYDGGMSIF